MNRGLDRAQVRHDVASGQRRRCQATQEAQDVCVRWNEIEGTQDAGNAKATSLASERNGDTSDARDFFADVPRQNST